MEGLELGAREELRRHKSKNDYWSGMGGGADDYFDDKASGDAGVNGNFNKGPNVPSDKYRCPPHPPDWISIRSELNYKYLWMHTGSHVDGSDSHH